LLKKEEEMDKQLLLKKINSYREAMIELQKNITAIPALGPESGGEGEYKRAEFLKKWIKENLGIENIMEINAPDERVPTKIRPNLIFFYPGKNNDKTIWIMTHMDIVPAGDISQWKNNPFQAWIEEDKLYGRGVEDNQQEMVASLFALKALKEEKIIPDYRIGIVLVADEETGSEYGISYVLDKKGDIFKKDDLIIVPDAGSPDGSLIEVAEKSILWCKFHIHGKQTHASTPELGINAHRAAAHLAVRLDNLHKVFNKTDSVFDPPISTFEPTKKENNVPNINTIPAEDIFYLDARILPFYSLKEIKKEIEKYCAEIEKEFKVKISIDYPQYAEAAPPTPVDSEVVIKLGKAIQETLGINTKAIGIGGGTVAAEFRRKNLNVAVWATQDELAHEPNEYIVIDNMIKDAKVYITLFTQES
jgi:succinyl-diaminopimelate desuccinylase